MLQLLNLLLIHIFIPRGISTFSQPLHLPIHLPLNFPVTLYIIKGYHAPSLLFLLLFTSYFLYLPFLSLLPPPWLVPSPFYPFSSPSPFFPSHPSLSTSPFSYTFYLFSSFPPPLPYLFPPRQVINHSPPVT